MKKRYVVFIRTVAAVAVLGLLAVLWLALAPAKEALERLDCLQKLEAYINQAKEEGFQEIEDGSPTIRVGKTQLVLSRDTGRFSLFREGEACASSSPEEAQLQRISSREEREKLASLAYISYYNAAQDKLVMTTSRDGVQEGVCHVLIKENRLRVYFVLGEKEEPAFVPEVLRAAVFEQQILPKADNAGTRRLKKYYQKYSIDDAMTTAERKELLARYPGLQDEDLYLFSGATDRLTEELAVLFSQAAYTKDQYAADLERIGYIGEDTADSDVFLLPLELCLENERLSAAVLTGQIVVGNPDCSLESVCLLPGFGWSESENGFLLLPDGGGAYVSLADKTAQGKSFTKAVYDTDKAVSGFEAKTSGTAALCPSYIYKAAAFGYAATAVSGAPMACINASIRGSAQPVTTACFTFTYQPHKRVETGKTDQMTVVNVSSQAHVTQAFEVRYDLAFEPGALLPEALLKRSREALTQYGVLPETTRTEHNSRTLFLDFYCLIRDEKKTGRTVVLSTLGEIQAAMERLYGQGVHRAVVTLKGLTDQGITTGMGNPFRISPKIGGEQGLKSLYETMKAYGYSLYLSYDLAQIYQDRLGDGFSPASDAAKGLEQLVLRRSAFDPVTLLPVRDAAHRQRYLASPLLFRQRAEAALRFFEKAGGYADGIALADSGLLYADYDKGAEVLRVQAQALSLEAHETMAARTSLLLEAPNSYLWNTGESLTDLPVYSSGLSVETYPFPYLPVLLSGKRLYAAESLTLAGDRLTQLLDTVLAGASLKASWITRPDSVLMETSYADMLASTCMETSFDSVIQAYRLYNQATAELEGQTLIGMVPAASKAYATLYSGGGALVVNKGEKAVQVGGVAVAPYSYAFVREGLK